MAVADFKQTNSAALDALVKVTDSKHPGYGYNPEQWRRWWENEKQNRALQSPKSADQVTSRSGGSPITTQQKDVEIAR